MINITMSAEISYNLQSFIWVAMQYSLLILDIFQGSFP